MSRKLDGEYRSGNRNKAQIILIVVMVAALGILMWGEKRESDARNEELAKLNEQIVAENQAKAEALKWKEAEDSFYQKLADGFDVNVLVVGDSIGEGAGTQTDGQQWYKQL